MQVFASALYLMRNDLPFLLATNKLRTSNEELRAS